MTASSTAPEPTSRRNLYLESRYRKLVRGLPQTIFWCPRCKGHRRRRRSCAHCEGFGKLTRTSVQELIGRRAVPAFKAREGRFHGAGREDVDVRMLGAGRPFVFELVGARRRDVDLEALRAEIVERAEGAIELEPFVPVARGRVAFWKEGRFPKRYRAEVEAAGPVGDAALEGLRGWSGEVVQRTPQRVAHRRADRERRRRVEVEEVGRRDGRCFTLTVRTGHGTYVKEWISGDEGRSEPSVGALVGEPCVCRALDVLEVVVDSWR